jgi:hypothetical protein
MATTDLRFLSAAFREKLDPDTRRRTGEVDMVLQCVTEKGHGRTVVIKDADEAVQLIEQLSHLVNTRRAIDKARAQREATARATDG